MRKHIELLFSFLSSSLTLNVVTYPLILGNIKTNCLITISKYPIKQLELVFVSTNFEITNLSNFINITSQISLGFFEPYIFSFCFLLSCQISTLLYYQKKIFVIIFKLADTNIFLRIYYSSSHFDLY